MSSSGLKPTYIGGNNAKIEVQADGSAMMTLRAGSVPKGKNEVKQKYSATIRVPKATGGFEDLRVEEEFTVRKPEVVINSATVQNLYRECANDVTIDVPALGNFYNPKVSVSSGSVTTSPQNKKLFRVIPTGKKCEVRVSNVMNGATTSIGSVLYNVIAPPRPAIDMAVNGKQTNGSVPVPKNSRIQVRIVPDPEFRAALPSDARYEISKITVKAQLSLGPPETVNNINLSGRDATKAIQVRLGSRVQQAPANTKIYLEVDKIYRKNFQNKLIEERLFSLADKTLSLVVR